MLLNNIAMDELLRSISDATNLLKCKICLMKLHKPVFLKICGHTFCYECISMNHLFVKTKVCPYCRTKNPGNEIISADYDRDKLSNICSTILYAIQQDFGEGVIQQMTANVPSIGSLLTGLTTEPMRDITSGLLDHSALVQHPVYWEAIQIKIKNEGNNEMNDACQVMKENLALECEMFVEEDTCKSNDLAVKYFQQDRNISGSHSLSMDTMIKENVKTEEVWEL